MKTKVHESFRKVAEDVFGPLDQSVGVPSIIPTQVPAPAAMQDGPSPQVLDGLCAMMAEAKHNAHTYRQGASVLKNGGFPEAAKFLKKMSGKWCDVAKNVGSFVEDLGGTICFKPVPGVGELPNDPNGMANHFFGLEKAVTAKILAFHAATEGKDVIVHEHLCHMLEKRMKMEGKVREFLRLTTLAGNDFMGLDHSVKHWMRG